MDVAVIGAGQAGLAIGHLLAREGRRFVILEAGDAAGSAWRDRWDSLVLFTAARYSGLPGLAFPGEPDHDPTRDEVISASRPGTRRSHLWRSATLHCAMAGSHYVRLDLAPRSESAVTGGGGPCALPA